MLSHTAGFAEQSFGWGGGNTTAEIVEVCFVGSVPIIIVQYHTNSCLKINVCAETVLIN